MGRARFSSRGGSRRIGFPRSEAELRSERFRFFENQLKGGSVLFLGHLSHECCSNVWKNEYYHSQTLRDKRQVLGVDGFEFGIGMDGPGSKDKLCRSRIEQPQ